MRRCVTVIGLLAAVLLLAGPAFARTHRGRPPFSDDPPRLLSLEGAPDAPAAGDVYEGCDHTTVLDGPTIPDLDDDGEQSARDGARGRLVAVRITGDGNLDPLVRLSDEEVRGLRGVSVEAWSEEIAKWKTFPPKAFEDSLPVLAAHALASPRAENRRRTIRGLSEIGTPAATDALLVYLCGGITPRPLPENQWAVHDWLVDIDRGRKWPRSEAAEAALVLARLGRREALPAIEALLPTATGEDLRVLTEAAALLR